MYNLENEYIIALEQSKQQIYGELSKINYPKEQLKYAMLLLEINKIDREINKEKNRLLENQVFHMSRARS